MCRRIASGGRPIGLKDGGRDAPAGAGVLLIEAAVPGAAAQGASAKRVGRDGDRALTPAPGQFVMALDTTVMKTAIATVANDVGTTVAGIQTAITLYPLVMASLVIIAPHRAT